MLFKLTSRDTNTVIADGLDEHADCIALRHRLEGKIERGGKHPKALDVGDTTRVTYQLIGRSLDVEIERTE